MLSIQTVTSRIGVYHENVDDQGPDATVFLRAFWPCEMRWPYCWLGLLCSVTVTQIADLVVVAHHAVVLTLHDRTDVLR